VRCGLGIVAHRHHESRQGPPAAEAYSQFDGAQKAHIIAQLDALLARIGAERKSLVWRLRALVGDRIKWYKDFEEVT
jgi:hypothetical protein